MERLLEKEYACVSIIREKKLIIVKWHEVPDEHQFWEVSHVIVKAFKIYFLDSMVNDFNKAGQLDVDYIYWYGQKVLPMLIKCGLRNYLLVDENNNIHPHISNYSESYAEKLRTSLTVQNYSDIKSALQSVALHNELVKLFSDL